MKTLVLATVSAAALLTAGGAFAQTTSGVEKQFDDARATLNAKTVATGEKLNSYSSQTGTSNAATIDQTNGGTGSSENTSVVIQGWNNGKSNNNTANATQSGTGDASLVMQRNYPESTLGSNTTTVNQTGKNENSINYVYGNSNTANITQSGEGTGAAGTAQAVKTVGDFGKGEAYATTMHGADQTATHLADNAAQVVQDEAVGNHATISQANPSASATITQWFAESNNATINQTGGVAYSGGKALIYQTQHDSNATINQDRPEGTVAEIFQVSSDQDGSAYAYGGQDSHNNTATINSNDTWYSKAVELQAGQYNTADITSGAFGDQSQDYSRQVGAYNESYTVQNGFYGLSLIDQAGQNNYAKATLSGDNDSSLIMQNGGSANTGYHGNQATVSQSGDFDVSRVNQSGANNYASVTQTKDNDFSLLTQVGTGSQNQATISQTSANATSVAFQTGSGNYLSLKQH